MKKKPKKKKRRKKKSKIIDHKIGQKRREIFCAVSQCFLAMLSESRQNCFKVLTTQNGVTDLEVQLSGNA